VRDVAFIVLKITNNMVIINCLKCKQDKPHYGRGLCGLCWGRECNKKRKDYFKQYAASDRGKLIRKINNARVKAKIRVFNTNVISGLLNSFYPQEAITLYIYYCFNKIVPEEKIIPARILGLSMEQRAETEKLLEQYASKTFEQVDRIMEVVNG